MFELGNFDDSIFGETKQRNTDAASQPYHVKTCQPMWFDECDTSDPDEIHNVYKYRGDDAFYRGQYQVALAAYDQCQEVLHSKNVTMWRDIQEARTRCLQYLGDSTGAVEAGTHLKEASFNFEQKTSALYLMADVYRHFNSYEEESETIQCLLQLHSTSPELWVRLAKVYANLSLLETSTTSSTNHLCPAESIDKRVKHQDSPSETEIESPNTHDVGMHTGHGMASKCAGNLREFTCLLRAGQLMKTFENNIGSFAKDRVVTSHKKVDEKVKQLNIPENKHMRCMKFLVKMKQAEDDIFLDDADKVEMQEKVTKSSFEEKWFSWDHEQCN